MHETSSARLKTTIINLLHKESLSLTGLQIGTGASLPTLRRVVQELVDAGWIRTVGRDDSTGGRPAKLYGLDGSSHLVIGAHVEIPLVNMVAADLRGDVVMQHCHTGGDGVLQPDEAVQAITQFTRQVLATYPDRRVLGIGMAAPGYVDGATGVILYVGRAPGWENYPMKARLEADLNIPVVMENDTDCLIRTELVAGNGRSTPDTIFLGILEGVKVSMLLNGQIYSGAFGNAGLIGRTRICSQRPSDTIHYSRELEDVASVSGVCREFDARLETEAPSASYLLQIRDMGDHKVKFRAILKKAGEGDAICNAVVEQMLDNLAMAVANLIYVLQPLVLVIGGALSSPPQKIRELWSMAFVVGCRFY